MALKINLELKGIKYFLLKLRSVPKEIIRNNNPMDPVSVNKEKTIVKVRAFFIFCDILLFAWIDSNSFEKIGWDLK